MSDSTPLRSIVINTCFGGFGLSREAFLRLRDLGCEAAKKEPDIGEMYDDGSGPRSPWCKSFGHDIPRDDPLLVQVVREMRRDANADAADLKIVDIPADVEWEISEYDGAEHIAEKHRTWG